MMDYFLLIVVVSVIIVNSFVFSLLLTKGTVKFAPLRSQFAGVIGSMGLTAMLSMAFTFGKWPAIWIPLVGLTEIISKVNIFIYIPYCLVIFGLTVTIESSVNAVLLEKLYPKAGVIKSTILGNIVVKLPVVILLLLLDYFVLNSTILFKIHDGTFH